MAGDETGQTTIGGGVADGPVVDDHEIVLTIPAKPEFLRLARLAAADVGSRCGLAYEEVDDLRIAVDELCHAIMPAAGSAPAAGSLEIRFSAGADRIVIAGACTGDVVPRLNELSTAILAAVVDEHELSGGEGINRFRMVKRVRLP